MGWFTKKVGNELAVQRSPAVVGWAAVAIVMAAALGCGSDGGADGTPPRQDTVADSGAADAGSDGGGGTVDAGVDAGVDGGDAGADAGEDAAPEIVEDVGEDAPNDAGDDGDVSGGGDGAVGDGTDAAVDPCAGKVCLDPTGPCEVPVCQDGQCKVVAAPDGSDCDDGDVCTGKTKCKAGTCDAASAMWVCPCKVGEANDGPLGCAKNNPFNKCAGTMACVKESTGNHACKKDPATVVTCDSSKDTTCLKNFCVPTVGKCEMTAIEDLKTKWNQPIPNLACDDGFACTMSDECKGGTCQPGTLVCECSPADVKNCLNKGFSDDPCKGKLVCKKYEAGPPPPGQSGSTDYAHCAYDTSALPVCTSLDGPCIDGTCKVQDGTPKCVAVPKKDDLKCDDGDPCTVNDACTSGVCKGPVDLCG